MAERAVWSSLDLILPPRCENCRRFGERLCALCRDEIEYIADPICGRCGYPASASAPTTDDCDQCRRRPFNGRGMRSLALHGGPLRRAIHSLKYRHNPPLSEVLAGMMDRRWPSALPRDAVLIPVPLSAERMKERGFNQAELLARHLGARRRRPVLTRALRRVRATQSQVGLTAEDRQSNVRGAFAADQDQARDLCIVLIDDVCTTGATLSACAAALLKMDAREVWAYTLARARFDSADPLL